MGPEPEEERKAEHEEESEPEPEEESEPEHEEESEPEHEEESEPEHEEESEPEHKEESEPEHEEESEPEHEEEVPRQRPRSPGRASLRASRSENEGGATMRGTAKLNLQASAMPKSKPKTRASMAMRALATHRN